MLRLAPLFSLALVVACGGSPSSTADKPADKPAAKPAEEKKEELKDRSQTPLVATKETIDGVGFTIDIPTAGFKREANERDKYVNWTTSDGNPFIEPSITAKLYPPMMAPRDLEAFARSATPAGKDKSEMVVARKEELPDGGMIVVVERSDSQFFKVEAHHRNGDKIVRCSVIQRTGTGKPDDKPIPNYPATRAWAEKICTSIKIE
jgi:hypothetical protein